MILWTTSWVFYNLSDSAYMTKKLCSENYNFYLCEEMPSS